MSVVRGAVRRARGVVIAAALLVPGLMGMLGTGAVTHASVVVPLSLSQLIAAAEVIADGQVVAIHTTADRGRVERVISVRVLETWKGERVEMVHVRLPGGTLGRTRVLVPGVPGVETGDRLVWFLTPAADGTFASVGLHQGAMRVWSSPIDGRQLVGAAPARDDSGVVRRGDGTRRPKALATLRGEVSAIVEASR